MSDLQTLEKVRDDISGMLDISRASLSAQQRVDRGAVAEGTALAYGQTHGQTHGQTNGQTNGQAFPRSKLMRAVTRHPFLIAATIATVWYVGPTRLGALAAAGTAAIARNSGLITPLVHEAVAAIRLRR